MNSHSHTSDRFTIQSIRLLAAPLCALLVAALVPGFSAAEDSLSERSGKIVRLEPAEAASLSRTDTKRVKLTEIQFEELNLEEISLPAQAFTQIAGQLELLNRDDFIKYVVVHQRIQRLERETKALRDQVESAHHRRAIQNMYETTRKSIIAEEGLTEAAFKEIRSVIASDNTLHRTFEHVKASIAYRGGMTAREIKATF